LEHMPPVFALPKKPHPEVHIAGAVSMAEVGGGVFPSALAMVAFREVRVAEEVPEAAV